MKYSTGDVVQNEDYKRIIICGYIIGDALSKKIEYYKFMDWEAENSIPSISSTTSCKKAAEIEKEYTRVVGRVPAHVAANKYDIINDAINQVFLDIEIHLTELSKLYERKD